MTRPNESAASALAITSFWAIVELTKLSTKRNIYSRTGKPASPKGTRRVVVARPSPGGSALFLGEAPLD